MRRRKHVPARRGFVTHYFYDARLSAPSDVRGLSKTEESARSACVVRIDAEQFNKAIVFNRDTGEALQLYRRDVRTGGIERRDHRYIKMLEEESKETTDD